MPAMTGGCLCGNVRFRADAEPVFVGLCHCRDCQKFSGSAFAMAVGLPKSSVTVTGDLKGYTGRGDPGLRQSARLNASPAQATPDAPCPG